MMQILKIGNKKYINFMIITGFSVFSIVANAQNHISLSQAINSGLANKKNILAGKLDTTISNLQTKALYQKYLPQVAAEYQYVYNPILQTSILPIGIFNPSYPIDATKSVQFGTKWTQSAGITATLALFDLTIKSHINEAKLQERIAIISQEHSENELAYSIAQTYIDIYLQEEKIKSLTLDTIRTNISYTLVKNKFDEKRLLKSDLNTSKINHNNIVQLLYDGIAQLIEEKVYLLFLMGTKEIEKWDFSVDSTIKNTISNINDTINELQLPELQQLRLQSELSSLQSKSERAKRLPTIGLKGYLGANQFTNTFNPIATNSWFGISYIGLDIKIPILSGENTNNKIQQHKLESNQYILQKEDKKLQYEKDIFVTQLKIENLKTQLKTKEENIILSYETIGIYQSRVLEGQETVSKLNLEEANLQVLKSNYEINKKQEMIYWLDYIKFSGQLTILWK